MAGKCTLNVQKSVCICPLCVCVCVLNYSACLCDERRWVYFAKLKIDFLTQEMKDRERERETDRQTSAERASLLNHAHSQS